MRKRLALAAVAAGVCGVIATPAGIASAETPQEVINRLQSQGYNVTVDKIGTGPINDCTVTSVRNPQQVRQWLPYVGPGLNGESVLINTVTSQTVSVSLTCPK